MRWSLMIFLVCWTGVSMAGKGEQKAMPKQLKIVFESLGYKAVKCEQLEGATSCLPLSIAYSLQLYDAEHDAAVMTSAMNQLSTQRAVVSRFNGIDRQLRDSPHTQAAAVSYFLAERLIAALNSPPELSALLQSLQRISEIGHHSVVQTAINTLRTISQNAGPAELSLRVNELIDDVRRDLNQFGSLETAVLLSMATNVPIFVVDASNGSEINLATITNSEGQLTFSFDNMNVEQEHERLHSLIQTGLSSEALHFVVSPRYGLLPLQNQNVLPREQPVLVEGTIRKPAAYSSNECSATCFDVGLNGFRKMGTSDGKSAKSRHSPKLKNGIPKEFIKDKWERYSHRSWQQESAAKPGLITFHNVAVLVMASVFSGYLYKNEKARDYLYQSVCGADDIGQCGQYYLHRAEDAGLYITHHAVNASRTVSAAVYDRVCGNLTLRECLQYYRGSDVTGGVKKEI
ncbi:hypothetical protein [Endozoicomonas lisbonensis]|uniref:Uncharacterized protein n=1 Tax=Endozoicomonas lisbonensis TaxID=3120522 RepID=A0ABV2SHQ6_9GAMM